MGHPRLDLLREDVRLEAGRAQVLLYGLGLVADGVAVAQGSQELMHTPGAHGLPGLSGAGGQARTVGAAVEASPRTPPVATPESRSRYFCSITSHE